MLAVGDIVTAEVTSTHVFGVFCRFGSDEMLVVVYETSWIAAFNSCLQFAEPGDRLTVKIRNIDTARGKVAASVRDLYPNPWATGEIVVGASYDARVVRYVESADRCNDQPGYLIELLPGSFAMIPAATRSLLPDERVFVKVVSADAQRSSVVLDWA